MIDYSFLPTNGYVANPTQAPSTTVEYLQAMSQQLGIPLATLQSIIAGQLKNPTGNLTGQMQNYNAAAALEPALNVPNQTLIPTSLTAPFAPTPYNLPTYQNLIGQAGGPFVSGALTSADIANANSLTAQAIFAGPLAPLFNDYASRGATAGAFGDAVPVPGKGSVAAGNSIGGSLAAGGRAPSTYDAKANLAFGQLAMPVEQAIIGDEASAQAALAAATNALKSYYMNQVVGVGQSNNNASNAYKAWQAGNLANQYLGNQSAQQSAAINSGLNKQNAFNAALQATNASNVANAHTLASAYLSSLTPARVTGQQPPYAPPSVGNAIQADPGLFNQTPDSSGGSSKTGAGAGAGVYGGGSNGIGTGTAVVPGGISTPYGAPPPGWTADAWFAYNWNNQNTLANNSNLPKGATTSVGNTDYTDTSAGTLPGANYAPGGGYGA